MSARKPPTDGPADNDIVVLDDNLLGGEHGGPAKA